MSTMQIGFPDGERVKLPVTEDLIEWAGVYYGDFEAFTRSDAMAPVSGCSGCRSRDAEMRAEPALDAR